MKYAIPFMDIQDVRVNFNLTEYGNKDFIELTQQITYWKRTNPTRVYEGEQLYSWEFGLEHRWFPVLITTNPWLAEAAKGWFF